MSRQGSFGRKGHDYSTINCFFCTFIFFFFKLLFFSPLSATLETMMNVKILKDKEELNTVAPCRDHSPFVGHLLHSPHLLLYRVRAGGWILCAHGMRGKRTPEGPFSPTWIRSIGTAPWRPSCCFPRKDDAPGTYLNFEINANGALLAATVPPGPTGPIFPKRRPRKFQVRATIEEDRWSAHFRIPLSVLERVYGPLELKTGSTFFCNFYKISESTDIEHYAAYAPITSPVPSFHMPEYFTEAVLV